MKKSKKAPKEVVQEAVQDLNTQQAPSRVVMIGTPSFDGKVDVYYVDSLIKTIHLCNRNNIALIPVFIAYDSLLVRARNDLFAMAHKNNVDDLVFIDADEGWQENDFARLLSHPVDLVGGTARRKSDVESYAVKIKQEIGLAINAQGLIDVSGIGSGFTRLSKRCIQTLWMNSASYIDKGEEKKDVYSVVVEDNNMISEDINMCKKWISLGGTVYFDPFITCDHIGIKKFSGDFISWARVNKLM